LCGHCGRYRKRARGASAASGRFIGYCTGGRRGSACPRAGANCLTMLITILSTVVVLGVLIFVHELGHFVTAKLVDIEVPRFSIGLGPKAFGFRRGETEYVISWLPLGGYVKMAGMEEMEQIEGGAPQQKHPVPA